MQFSELILSNLQQRFCIAFKTCNYQSEDRFSMTFSGDGSRSLVMDLLIKSDSRLKLNLHTGNYAADILSLFSNADETRLSLFETYWKKIQQRECCKLKVFIGQKPISEVNQFAGMPLRDRFEIAFEAFPFYDPDDDNRVEVVSCCVCEIWSMLLALIPYTVEGEIEGGEYEKTIKTHERNPVNRELCLLLKGYECAVCGMSFERVYGKIGRNYIEIHHTKSVADMGEGHRVDVLNELVPLCSNCHSMAHRRKPPFSVAELRSFCGLSNNEESSDE